MASTYSQEQSQRSFNRVLLDFTRTLGPEQKNDFEFSTLAELQSTINKVQERQGSERKMRNLTRLSSFLEAMEQYGKVVEVFLNTSAFVAFIWGPMKFLLQVASSYAEAFDALLDAYQQIGEDIPLLAQYQALFQRNPHMRKVLEMIYADILEFHRKAIRYFRQKAWRQLFQATWKTFRTEFSAILDNLRRHSRLVESQASLVEFEQLFQELQRQRIAAEAEVQSRIAEEERQRRIAVWNWLCAARTQSDQDKGVEVRNEYPSSGRWLLQNSLMQAWLNLEWCSGPLLWVNGIPGAGKTVLASLIIEECERMRKEHSISVAYFYCKHNDSRRDNFTAVIRGLLVQILQQNDSLLPYLYENVSSSGEPLLESLTLARELLETAVKSVEKLYVIIDGIDECDKDERRHIITWFRSKIDSQPESDSDSLRCLFFSQDDGVIGKLLSRKPVIQISSEDTKDDIRGYTAVWSLKIQEKFHLPEAARENIVKRVTETAKGMFLFAKLVMENLYSQTRQANLTRELEPGRFPRGLEDAYARIVDRILKDPSAKEDAARLLGWLVCAKRPMKWHEIQGAMSIDLESRDVDFEGRQLRVDSKELCGSLVEKRSDGCVELVHLTARFFLLQQNYINQTAGELELARLCIGYLGFECFDAVILESDVSNFVQTGSYSFLDYAAIHWLEHLKQWMLATTVDDSITQVAVLLSDFLGKYWSKSTPHGNSKEAKKMFSRFQDCNFFGQLIVAVSRWEKQVTTLNRLAIDTDSLDLIDRISKIRSVLENNALSSGDGALERTLKTFYGPNLFKCSSVSCRFFHEGFSNKEQRDRHVAKHNRAFICTYTGCPYGAGGFSTLTQLNHHLVDWHEAPQNNTLKFPATQDPKTINIKRAIKHGSVEEVERWLEQFDIEPAFKVLRHQAFEPTILKGDIEIMKILLDRTNISKVEISSLCKKALKWNQDTIALLLLDFPDAEPYLLNSGGGFTFLYDAIQYGRTSIVKRLVEDQRFDPNHPISTPKGEILPLVLAAQHGHKTIVQLLLDKETYSADQLVERDDIDVDQRDGDGRTVLSRAAQAGHEAVVKLLVDRNDVNVDSKDKYGQTPLSYAARQGHETIVKLLADRHDVDADSKDNNGRTPLSLAAAEWHREEVIKLLADRDDVNVNSKDIDGRTPLSWAAQVGQEGIVRLLADRNDVDVNSRDNDGQTPLSWAVQAGKEGTVRLLADRNDVDVNSRDNLGRTPLVWAVTAPQWNNGGVVRLLVGRDDVNVDSKDIDGRTPLSWAAHVGREDIVRLLADRNDVDVDSKDKSGRTPLSWAATADFISVRNVSVLVGRDDVDVDSTDNNGRTPLSHAAQYGVEMAVRILAVRNDVDVNSRDNLGRTPLDWAAEAGRTPVDWVAEAGRTPLDWAAEAGRTPVDWLAEAGRENIVRILEMYATSGSTLQ